MRESKDFKVGVFVTLLAVYLFVLPARKKAV